jgi:hypothetical protein
MAAAATGLPATRTEAAAAGVLPTIRVIE